MPRVRWAPNSCWRGSFFGQYPYVPMSGGVFGSMDFAYISIQTAETFSMEYFVWNHDTGGTYQHTSVWSLELGVMVHARRVPNISWRGPFLAQHPRLRGIQWHGFGLQIHPIIYNFRLEWLVWVNGTQETCQTRRCRTGGHVTC